jgi:hypothetical protein
MRSRQTRRPQRLRYLYPQSFPPEPRQAALELARSALANQRKRNDHNRGWTCQTGGIAECYAQ